ncbi:hypothetical protein GCM10017786_75810 [Amycolatopsis deserti]|uniref:DNA-binding phage zinc finger domain-containing protein n=1 Tax=Amycolatopsis deserti TaxID=185696 RepID=A0ABQ3JKV0_9PSEU|nr:hypothetical protein [Amycolatopsis deserti]GHF30711.1 hypothetical protein GCM10017786_75810 [Amycolatopsis deserti]
MTGLQRGQYPAALFWPGTDEPETRDNPRLRPCPWPPCHAAPGQDCTTTIRGRRKPLTGYHEARTIPTEENTMPDQPKIPPARWSLWDTHPVPAQPMTEDADRSENDETPGTEDHGV